MSKWRSTALVMSAKSYSSGWSILTLNGDQQLNNAFSMHGFLMISKLCKAHSTSTSIRMCSRAWCSRAWIKNKLLIKITLRRVLICMSPQISILSSMHLIILDKRPLIKSTGVIQVLRSSPSHFSNRDQIKWALWVVRHPNRIIIMECWEEAMMKCQKTKRLNKAISS